MFVSSTICSARGRAQGSKDVCWGFMLDAAFKPAHPVMDVSSRLSMAFKNLCNKSSQCLRIICEALGADRERLMERPDNEDRGCAQAVERKHCSSIHIDDHRGLYL